MSCGIAEKHLELDSQHMSESRPTEVAVRRSDLGGRPVLTLDSVSVTFHSEGGAVAAVHNVALEVGAGEIVALVGESGSGKSTLALACAGLLAKTARVTGSIRLGDAEITGSSEAQLRALRGRQLGFVFQDPLTSLNPLLTIGTQIAEVATTHLGMRRQMAVSHAHKLLRDVRIEEPERRSESYPHQFSGGMRQRALLASALAGEPQLLIADEPTTALDVTVQAEILDLVRDLCKQRGLGVLFITHNLGVASTVSDRLAVLYAGEIVEIGSTSEIFARPLMPYTVALLESHPSHATGAGQMLAAIPGEPPIPGSITQGCRFANRCRHRRDLCMSEHPPLSPRAGTSRFARCWGTEPDTGWIA